MWTRAMADYLCGADRNTVDARPASGRSPGSGGSKSVTNLCTDRRGGWPRAKAP